MFKKIRKFLSKAIKGLTKLLKAGFFVLEFMRHLDRSFA